MTQQDMIEVLSLALEALRCSKPVMAHYVEPVSRHNEAIVKVRKAIEKLRIHTNTT